MCVPSMGPRPSQANQATQEDQQAMTQVTLTVPAISCGHCARTVSTALAGVDGVGGVRVDVPAKRVAVSYDAARTGVEQLEEALRAADYPVAAVDAGATDPRTAPEAVAGRGCRSRA